MLGLATAAGTVPAAEHDAKADKAWQAAYDARQAYFEKSVGPLPRDILKMANMIGVWPGGGLFEIPAKKLGPGLSMYTTFGFTNPDMPTSVRMAQFASSPGAAQGTLQAKTAAPKVPGRAGYGYEIVVVADSGAEWPLGFLQWAVVAELGNDAGLFDRVEKYDGLTVEKIDTGAGEPVNVLIGKAQAPLPTGTSLPNGKMELLVATTITDEEMRWSMQNGRGALAEKLRAAGVGQISRPGRPSVVP
jgi:hypothetical protein